MVFGQKGMMDKEQKEKGMKMKSQKGQVTEPTEQPTPTPKELSRDIQFFLLKDLRTYEESTQEPSHTPSYTPYEENCSYVLSTTCKESHIYVNYI